MSMYMIIPYWMDEERAEEYREAIRNLNPEDHDKPFLENNYKRKLSLLEGFDTMHQQDGTVNRKQQCKSSFYF